MAKGKLGPCISCGRVLGFGEGTIHLGPIFVLCHKCKKVSHLELVVDYPDGSCKHLKLEW